MAEIVPHSDVGLSRRAALLLGAPAVLALSLGVGVIAATRPDDDPADSLPQPEQDYSQVDPGYAPEQLVWAVPLIKKLACIRAVHAVKYQLRPALLFGPNCLEIPIEMDEALIHITVTGAVWNETVDHPFTVTLQHYPSSLNTTGYIIRSIDIR